GPRTPPRPPRSGRAELLTRMGEASRLGGGVEDLELVPVHLCCPAGSFPPPPGRVFLLCPKGPDEERSGLDRPSRVGPPYSAAARRSALAARNRSASSAAMQPRPAAVTAWR